jgi:streptogramin lyase
MTRLLHLYCFENILEIGTLSFQASSCFSVTLRSLCQFRADLLHPRKLVTHTEELPMNKLRMRPRLVALLPTSIVFLCLLVGLLVGCGASTSHPSGLTEFPIPTSQSSPKAITAGPDGNLWFTEQAGNKIGRITPSGTITEFPIPTSQSTPIAITAGPDGNLWFTEEGGNKIGRITTK